MQGLDEGSKRVIAIILKEEKQLGPSDNFLTPVMLGSALLDKSLVQLVADPAREISDEIIDSHITHDRRYNVKALEGWRDGKIPASLGMIGMILLGLRRGLKQQRELLKSFINKKFYPEYEECLMDMRMIKTVDYVRCKYRNPACHLSRDEFQRNTRIFQSKW